MGTERTQYSGLNWSNYRKEKLASSVQKCSHENINVKLGEILLSEDYVSFQARNQVLYMLKTDVKHIWTGMKQRTPSFSQIQQSKYTCGPWVSHTCLYFH